MFTKSGYVSPVKGRLNSIEMYNTIQYNTIQYNTIQYNTIQYNTTLLIPSTNGFSETNYIEIYKRNKIQYKYYKKISK